MKRSTLLFACGLALGASAACSEDKNTAGTLDADGDGWEIDEDCDDSDAQIHPGAPEICEDGIDNNCSGADAVCVVDNDNDGWPAADDCDDGNDQIHPGMPEDCQNAVDDNCDGVASECLSPELVYEPLAPDLNDAYGAAVYADYLVFGEPGGDFGVEDGRALFFDFESGPVVDELDAVLTSTGEAGEAGGYGIVLTPVGPDLCIGADYHDGGSSDVGKSWCFSEATVRGAEGTLALADASYTTSGEQSNDFATAEAQADVDGDGFLDLLVYTSHDVHVIAGDGTPWSGDYSVPLHADYSLGGCASSTSGWCGFARAVNQALPASLAISAEGGAPDTIFGYSLPRAGGGAADHSALVQREFNDSATAIATNGGFAFGDSSAQMVGFLDHELNWVSNLYAVGGQDFGYWSSTFIDQDGHELLLVSDPKRPSPAGLSSGEGVVYVFDLTAHGLPLMADAAKYVLVPPADFQNCGWRARGGVVRDAQGSYTTVAISCRGAGGAAYKLDDRAPPPPTLAPAAIVEIGPGHYAIRQWVIDAYGSQLAWMMSLAQTEAVFDAQGNVRGWRLHAIAVDSPLHRAGLRAGDVLRRVNGTELGTPTVINDLFAGLGDADGLTLAVVRNGITRQVTYDFVP